MEYKDPGRYIPVMFLLYSWGSLFGIPSKVPLLYIHSRTLGLIYDGVNKGLGPVNVPSYSQPIVNMRARTDFTGFGVLQPEP